MLSHHVEIIVELIDQVVDFRKLNFDDEGIRQLSMLSWNYQIVSLRNEHFDMIVTISKIMLSCIEGLLFYYLICGWLLLHLILPSGISFGFSICIVADAFIFPFDDEIRLAMVSFFFDQWIFTYVFEHLFSFFFIFLPLQNVIISWFILESFQNQLIFFCYFHQFSFSGISIQTSSLTSSCCQWSQNTICSAHHQRSVAST